MTALNGSRPGNGHEYGFPHMPHQDGLAVDSSTVCRLSMRIKIDEDCGDLEKDEINFEIIGIGGDSLSLCVSAHICVRARARANGERGCMCAWP